jgi:hypothetical protein
METKDSTSLFYKDIIGVQSPWIITDVAKDEASRKVTIRIEHKKGKAVACPVCGQSVKKHDCKVRVLRYLDTCQYETFIKT